jgi:hypothetical protein
VTVRVEDGGARVEVRTVAARRLIRWLLKNQDRFDWHAGSLVLTWGQRGTEGRPTDHSVPFLRNEGEGA